MTPKKCPQFTFKLAVKTFGLEPILGAAYLFTDRAFVRLSGSRAKEITVELTFKAPLSSAEKKAFPKDFRNELASQKLRWAISKNNLPIQEHIALQAIALANNPAGAVPPPAAAPSNSEPLTDDQRKEIERLISEVEDEIRAMADKKAVQDPQIAATWEEKNAR